MDIKTGQKRHTTVMPTCEEGGVARRCPQADSRDCPVLWTNSGCGAMSMPGPDNIPRYTQESEQEFPSWQGRPTGRPGMASRRGERAAGGRKAPRQQQRVSVSPSVNWWETESKKTKDRTISERQD